MDSAVVMTADSQRSQILRRECVMSTEVSIDQLANVPPLEDDRKDVDDLASYSPTAGSLACL